MRLLLDREEVARWCGVTPAAVGKAERRGLPVVRRGRGRGDRSQYDFREVDAWARRTGFGMVVPWRKQEREASPLSLHELAEQTIGEALDIAAGGVLALMLAEGIPERTAMRVFDLILLALFSALEEELGREARIPIRGVVELLTTGREEVVLEHARRVAAAYAEEDPADQEGEPENKARKAAGRATTLKEPAGEARDAAAPAAAHGTPSSAKPACRVPRRSSWIKEW